MLVGWLSEKHSYVWYLVYACYGLLLEAHLCDIKRYLSLMVWYMV